MRFFVRHSPSAPPRKWWRWSERHRIFVDVEAESFNIDAKGLAAALATAKRLGLTPKAVIPVDLYGLPADHDAVAAVAKDANLFVLDDAAQAFGADYKGRKLGTFGHATATSFFPAKPLGCYGDGGAVLTDDDEMAEVMRSLRVHGYGSDRYDNVRIGMTSRLDTIQAAVLTEKLKIFPDEIEARDRIARRYSERTCRCCDYANRTGGINLSVGAIYHPGSRRPARQVRDRAQGRGHPHSNLLSDTVASAAGLQALPGRRGRGGSQRSTCRRGHQPAHARLSR